MLCAVDYHSYTSCISLYAGGVRGTQVHTLKDDKGTIGKAECAMPTTESAIDASIVTRLYNALNCEMHLTAGTTQITAPNA